MAPRGPGAPSWEERIARTATTARARGRAGSPRRVAALDVGSNAIRYIAAEAADGGHFVELESHRFPVRLGHDAFTVGELSPASVEATVAAAVHFSERLDALGTLAHRAVATSAVRESRNGDELVELVRARSGIELEMIAAGEEARLVWTAVRRRVSLGDRRWLLADLGGGSLEISLVTRERIVWSESHPLGAVRLLDEPGHAGAGDPLGRVAERFPAPENLLRPSADDIAALIITGGNAEAIADVAGAAAGAAGVAEMSRSDLRRVLALLATMSCEQRIERLGLRPDRADVILPAAAVFDLIAGSAPSGRVLVPRVGVKEGILYDLAGR
jgi:exopolyphosphatase / guanosine-5'-triphosphate,3'-diphosphate pyrophosphatase